MSVKIKKRESVAKINEILSGFSTIIVVKNNGITAKNTKILRLRLHKIKAGVLFIKNTLLRIAADQANYVGCIKNDVLGSNLIIYSNDIFSLLKNIIDFLQYDVKLEVVSCYYESEAVRKDAISLFSKMSSIDDLYYNLYASMQMPLVNFYRVMQVQNMQFSHILESYKDIKSKE